MEKLERKPLVSIIVPTCNSQETIEQCLGSVRKQTYEKIETLIVDRHSTDNTAQLAKRVKANLFLLDCERSKAKNHGARKARGDFVLFIDSDMVLSPEVVEDCVNKCVRQKISAVIIPEESVGQGTIGDWRKSEKASLSTSGKLMEIPRFFRKRAFLQTGGYDERLVCGEDFDLFQRFEKRGYKTGKIEPRITHLEGKSSLRSVLSKAFHYGRTLPALLKKSPSQTIERYSGMRLASIETARTTFRGVTSLAGFTALKLLEYTAYFLGISTQLLHDFSEKIAINKLKDRILENKSVIVNLAIILLISTAIFRNLLFTQEWPGGGDVLGFVSRAYLYGKDFRWIYMWRPYSFGFVEGINFMDFFLMLLYAVFKDPSWTVKAFMFLSYLAAGFLMYLFAYRYTRMHIASLAASLVYILNQWLFSQLTEAHVDIVFSYALAPLIFLLLDKALRSGRPRDILLFCVGLSIFATSFHPEAIVIYGVFLIIFAAFFIFFPNKTQTVKARLLRFLKVSLPSALIVFLFSAFFLFPFVANVRSPYVRPSYEYPLEDSVWGSYQNVTDAFTLRAVEKWGYNNVVDVYSGLGLPDFPVYALLFSIFILSYFMLLVRRDRYTIFFAISTLLSVFIAKGPHPPLGQVFIWAWFNIPHFAIFRAANRWIMMAIFSNAFFVSLLVSQLAGYIKTKPYRQTSERFFKIEVKNGRLSKIRRVIVSVDFFNNLFKRFHNALYFLSVILLALILVSGFLSCFFFFSDGLQVYTPPSSYLAPYEWLAPQKDDYKVVSVGRSSYEWLVSPDQYSDFASSAMQTTLGWGHDIGFDSVFIHDKPVLQDGGWDPKPRQLVDYLRFRLAREHLTDNLLKILGAFAYKYVIIPPYTTDKTREFFMNQTGYQVIYNQTALVLQNEYVTPRIFATNRSMLVLGGLESFDMLSKIEAFRLNETALFFAPTTIEGNVMGPEILARSQMLGFINSDVLDLAMASLDAKTSIIYASNYGVSSINTTAYWVKMSSWRIVGALVLGGDTLTTSGKNKAEIPFDLSTDGIHDLWLRIGFAPSRGKLSVSVDGDLVQEIRTESSLWSKLSWLNVTRLDLGKGKHVITLENDGTGFNDVDAIAIVEPQYLESRINETVNVLKDYHGRLLYLLEAENTLLGPSSTGWSWTQELGNGYVAQSESLGLNVAPLAIANASSSSNKFEAQKTVDRNMDTRWASEKYVLPQWLELDWDQPQQLRGVGIHFENAIAANYTVQTWDGTTWIDQVQVAGNSELDKTHRFAQTVETNKIRIYVTASSIYDRVSIRELEAYSTETTSAPIRITIPRKGNFMFAARIATGPNYGTLYFKIDNTLQPIPCNSSTNQFEWREIGPFNLDAGEQSIGVGSDGLVELDEIVIYSLDDAETSLSLSELFSPSNPQVSIGYKEVNSGAYQVDVAANESFNLMFSETYDPSWKAIARREEITSTIAYSLVNSFYVNRTGQFTITIYFTGQDYANIGIITSAVSFASISVSLPILSVILRKRRLFLQKNREV